ncbi:MAG: class A beta-lactamase-related serine hydrolase [Chloroflexi bacterium]|nr:class A beta-lactamase-related serine hydrolase [Chloroflexota bacterium]
MTDLHTALPRTAAAIERGIAEGLQFGAQAYVSVNGTPVADGALGEDRPGVPLQPEFLLRWLSAVKPVGAVAIGQLWEAGKLQLDDRVTRFIPEFGKKGKSAVTLRHLLTHTSGLKQFVVDEHAVSWEQLLDRISMTELHPDWTPGYQAEYSPSLGWFVLGEIIQRIDGRPYHRYVREEIFTPLDMRDSWIALPPAQHQAYGDRLGTMYATPRPTPSPVLDAPDEDFYWPGGSARGPIRELGYFYEMLLFRGERNGVRLISAQTVAALTACHRCGMVDQTFRRVMDWGLGFLVTTQPPGGEVRPYDFGKVASPRAFGHGGSRSSLGFADPQHGLVVTWVLNGMVSEARHQERNHEINSAIYEDLGFV